MTPRLIIIFKQLMIVSFQQTKKKLKDLLVGVTRVVSATPSKEGRTAEIVKSGEKANTYCKMFYFYIFILL